RQHKKLGPTLFARAAPTGGQANDKVVRRAHTAGATADRTVLAPQRQMLARHRQRPDPTANGLSVPRAAANRFLLIAIQLLLTAIRFLLTETRFLPPENHFPLKVAQTQSGLFGRDVPR